MLLLSLHTTEVFSNFLLFFEQRIALHKFLRGILSENIFEQAMYQ